ncbi:MAG: response regulator [Candidatus Dormibacterales bacterium]
MATATAIEQVGIVIIDDAPRTLDNLKKLLAFEPDIDVLGTAVSARAGIEQARRLRPDLVLMDVNLPDLDGIRATEILSAELPLTPVVIMSVQEDREYLRRAMQAGAREFLVKPFSADELVAAIRRVNQMESLKRGDRAARGHDTAGKGQRPAASRQPAHPPGHAGGASAGPAPEATGPQPGGSGRPRETRQPVPAANTDAPAASAPPAAAPGQAAAPEPVVAVAPPAAPPSSPSAGAAPAASPPVEPDSGGTPGTAVFEKKRSGDAEVAIVYSGKGGVGKSVIATNLAASIARESGEEVALLDLDLQFGDDAVLLGLEPTRTITDVIEHYPEVDAPFITALMLEAAPHLRVLPAPISPELADLVTPDHVRKTLEVLRASFDHLVVDCSSHLGDVTLTALDCADRIVLVSDLGIPAIKETKLSLKLFESLGVPREKIFLVVNRADAGSEVTVEQAEANLRFPVSVQIPSRDKVVLNAISKGSAFVNLAPDSDISLRIKDLAGQLAALGSRAGRSASSRKLRFWQRPA